MSEQFSQTGVDQNKGWFEGNTEYSERQERLPYYGYIRLMVSREIEGQNRVLDIGNGGFFNYDTSLAQSVTAVDLFVKDGPGASPNVMFKSGSILDLPFSAESFDCVLLQNVLHHVTGASVSENRRNLKRCLSEMFRCTAAGGKAVLLESTVANWFYAVECLLFSPARMLHRGGHPVTFQYTPEQILEAASEAGYELEEYAMVPARGLSILQFGYVWPTCLTPARVFKFVFGKRG